MDETLRTVLAVKTLERNDGGRWIIGRATTPDTDLVGDQVDPTGAVFDLPLPLLRGHDHDRAIGAVTEATASPSGITVRAKLTEGVADSDEAWLLVQDRALRGLSIGFLADDAEPLPGGGRRFTRWRWTELSLVAVAANPAAGVESTIGKGLVTPAHDTHDERAITSSGPAWTDRLADEMADIVLAERRRFEGEISKIWTALGRGGG